MTADNPTVGTRSLFAVAAAVALFALVYGPAVPAAALTPGPPCGEKVITSPSGIAFRILFANNGTVQQYIVTAGADNPELVNDARIALENTYGPEGIDAPPLKIIAFKPGGNGMQVPDKAIDSCGRTLTFN
jgi:hypothetical protein